MSRKGSVCLLALSVVTVLGAAGALYQWLSVRSETRRFPPPGRMVNVAGPGGRRLHLVCLGQGEPAVIFESSGFGGALSSRTAREELSAYARVCSYDRAGMGWSDPGPGVMTAGMLAGDLERLTIEAGLKPPFYLVAASIGGLTAELFARRHPEQVAGLVFVDAATSVVLERFSGQITWKQVEAVCLAQTAARLGMVRLLNPFRLRDEQTIARLYRVEPMAAICSMARGMQTTIGELANAPPLPSGIPVTVLVHEKPDGMVPTGIGVGSPGGRVVPGSDHLIGNSQPRAVSGAVIEMLAGLRR